MGAGLHTNCVSMGAGLHTNCVSNVSMGAGHHTSCVSMGAGHLCNVNIITLATLSPTPIRPSLIVPMWGCGVGGVVARILQIYIAASTHPRQ